MKELLNDPHDSYGEHESYHYKAMGFDDDIQKEKHKPYVMPRWLGSLIGMAATSILLWGKEVVRIINALTW